jgi:hypothetical protein
VQDYIWAKNVLLTEAALDCLERPVAFDGPAVLEPGPAAAVAGEQEPGAAAESEEGDEV